MSRRPSVAATASAFVAFALGGCGEPKPWDQPGWRPEQPPQRIVLASVLAAEALLGIVPDERLAGVHYVAADPGNSLVAAAARAFPLVGAAPEDLLAVRPDLVLVDAFTSPETLGLLAGADVPVVRTDNPTGFDDIAANLRRLGRVTHLDAPLDERARAMQDELSQLARSAPDVAGWRVLCIDGSLHSYGTGSLFDAVARAAGARNVAAEQGVGPFRKLDIEEVLAWRPDALVLSVHAGHTGGRPSWLEQYVGLGLLPCVRRDRLVMVPFPQLSTTSHRLVETVALLQRQLRAWGKP